MASANPAVFYRQLATLLSAGLPVSRALQTLSLQFKGGIGRAAQQMQHAIDNGATLTEAATHCRSLFSRFELQLLHTGEISGRLDNVLGKMADARESRSRLQRQLVSKLLYPMLLIHVAIGVQALVTWFQANDGGSAALRILLGGFGPLYSLVAILWLLSRLGHRLPIINHILGAIAYSTPILGTVVRRLSLARFARTFETLYASGISTVDAIPLCAQTCGNAIMATNLRHATPLLADGHSLTEALTATHAFDAVTLGMIATGEQSGRLDSMLDTVARTAEEEAHQAIERMGILIPFAVYIIIVIAIAIQIIQMVTNYVNILDTI